MNQSVKSTTVQISVLDFSLAIHADFDSKLRSWGNLETLLQKHFLSMFPFCPPLYTLLTVKTKFPSQEAKKVSP